MKKASTLVTVVLWQRADGQTRAHTNSHQTRVMNIDAQNAWLDGQNLSETPYFTRLLHFQAQPNGELY